MLSMTAVLPLTSWLIAKDRKEEALVVLAALENKPEDDAFVLTQLHNIEYSVQYEIQHATKWRDLARRNKTGDDTKTLRRLLLGAGTQFMQQFQGINIMSYYLPTVLTEAVGLSNHMARLLTACTSVSYLVVSCIVVPYVERWGRRRLMLLSSAGQFLSFLVITILLRFADNYPRGSPTSSLSKSHPSASKASAGSSGSCGLFSTQSFFPSFTSSTPRLVSQSYAHLS